MELWRVPRQQPLNFAITTLPLVVARIGVAKNIPHLDSQLKVTGDSLVVGGIRFHVFVGRVIPAGIAQGEFHAGITEVAKGGMQPHFRKALIQVAWFRGPRGFDLYVHESRGLSLEDRAVLRSFYGLV